VLEPVFDLSPIQGELTPEDEAWLRRISELNPSDYRVGISDGRVDDEPLPIVEQARDGRWWAGRYIGAVTVDGRQLVILPRLGIEVVEAWLDQAFGLVAPPASAHHTASDAFIIRLLARLWCRSVDGATRHGLPLFRLPRGHEGVYVRGRLDVARTLVLLGQGREAVASVTYERSLAHPVTRAIVCAERALVERLHGSGEWRTPRVREVLPQLRAGVGFRPRLPTRHELDRVRYTPITLPFKHVATLSHRIASHLGYSSLGEGNEEGVLVDVAELWELFVLNCVRLAAPASMRVEHGTRRNRRDYLLKSEDAAKEIGRLKPDVIISDGDRVVAVLDAKYKRLRNTPERPNGVDRADLYQLVAYAMRFDPRVVAALIYPMTPGEDPVSTAEGSGPWRSDRHTFAFTRLRLTREDARADIRELVAPQGVSMRAA
jgi:5-methylcytosine-specific restriction enzyme subunit McrC